MYAIRWLTDTLPHDQQTDIYRQRQSEMVQMIDQLRAGGFAG
jgi:lipase chaperone LimK